MGGIIGKKAARTDCTKPAEAAKALGITCRELAAWAKLEGFPGNASARGKPGRYPIAAIKHWRKSRGEADLTEQICTTAFDAALALGVSRKTFDQWSKRPGFPGQSSGRGSPGRYPIEEIRAWRNATIPQPHNLVALTDEDYKQRIASARLTQEETKAASDLVDLEKKLGNLVQLDEAVATLERVIATAKAYLGEIGHRIDARLPADLPPKTRKELKRIVSEACDKAYTQIEEALLPDPDDEIEEEAGSDSGE